VLTLNLELLQEEMKQNRESAITRARDSIAMTRTTLERMRRLAHQLRPPALDALGLMGALEQLCLEMQRQTKLTVVFVGVEETRLSPEVNLTLYRFVQEALTNVVRHSGASEVCIRLETAHGELHLRVDDNGRGFRPQPERPEGLGLKIMRYRAQMLGGDLAIAWAGSGGASVRCSCPLATSGLGSA